MFGIIYIFNLLCLNSNMCNAPFENHPRVMREACLNKVLLPTYTYLFLDFMLRQHVGQPRLQLTLQHWSQGQR